MRIAKVHGLKCLLKSRDDVLIDFWGVTKWRRRDFVYVLTFFSFFSPTVLSAMFDISNFSIKLRGSPSGNILNGPTRQIG